MTLTTTATSFQHPAAGGYADVTLTVLFITGLISISGAHYQHVATPGPGNQIILQRIDDVGPAQGVTAAAGSAVDEYILTNE